MKAQARIKAPDEFYDIKLNQAQLSIEELSIYVKVDAKLGLNKLRKHYGIKVETFFSLTALWHWSSSFRVKIRILEA